MSEDLLKKYSFKEFPFPISPLEDPKIWADLKEIREKITKMLKMDLSIPSSFFSLIWGVRGTGKTYAMNYFIKKECRDKELKDTLFSPVIIKAHIAVSKDVYENFYLNIIDGLETEIKPYLSGLPKVRGPLERPSIEEELLRELYNITPVERIRRVIAAWISSMINRDERKRERIKNILILKKPRSKELPLQLSIDDVPEVLSVLFNFLPMFILSRYNKRIRFILWVDEWENIESCPIMERLRTNDLIRFLIDNIPYNLSLIVNVTLRPGDQFPDIIRFFTDQVYDRISRKIEFPPLNKDDCFKYVCERLEFFSEEEKSDKYAPFTEKSIIYIISLIQNPTTPRILNKVFANILMEAFVSNVNIIDSRFINDHRDLIMLS